jgi:PAS domain S-box-containing protein
MSVAVNATILLDSLPVPALVVDAGGRIAATNAAMARCLACEEAQLVGSDLAVWAIDPAALRDFLDGSAGSSRGVTFRAGDGSERHLEISIGRSVFADGTLLCAFDVTARRATEQRLQGDVERLRDIAGVGGGTIYEMDSTLTRIRMWRRGTENGVPTVVETTAKFPDDVIDPTFHPEEVAEANRRYANREPVQNFQYRLPGQDGKQIYRMGNSVAYYDRNGVYQGRRGVSVDVTPQVLAEQALHRAREHLEHAQRVAATGSSERDLVTGALEWSEEMYRLAGVDRASFALTDANIFALVHDEDRERLKAVVLKGRTGVHPPPIEYRMRRADGEIRTFYCETDVISDQAGKPVRVLTVFKDVTELRAAEKRQKEMEQQLLHSQKLRAVGTLAGGVAHELNNTLVPILALTKLTLKRLPERSQERHNLTIVLRATERARDLVQQISAFSRKEMPSRCSVDIAGLAREAMRMMRASVPSTIHIDEAIDQVPSVLADADQLQQIIINLVNNAAQAIGDRHGTIVVEVATAPSDKLPADAPQEQGSVIRLSVSDTGCGMDEATQTRIFEPFFTTKPVGEGTGLGLSVVHGIVTQHGGSLVVESQIDKGTRFDIFLPALPAGQRVQTEAPTPIALLAEPVTTDTKQSTLH